MTFYADMAAVATGLLTEFGAPMAVQRGGAVDPVTGAGALGDAGAATVVMRRYPARAIDGERVQAGDRELIVAPGYTPEMPDVWTIDGQAWRTMRVDTISPAGVPVVYLVQVRR